MWASANPSLGEEERRACAALLDGMPQREAWELSTFGFATDEATAWALCAWICDAVGGDGIVQIEGDGGPIYVLLRNAQATS